MWYYAIGDQKLQARFHEIVEKLVSGELPLSTLVWTDGMANWQPASEVKQLMDVVSTRAPKTPPPPQQPSGPLPDLGPVGKLKEKTNRKGVTTVKVSYSATHLLGQTKAFFVLRVLVALAMFVGLLLVMGLFIGIAALVGFDNGAGLFVALVGIVITLIIYSLVSRYVMFLVKAGHTAAITEIIRTGQAPQVNGSKHAITYAKNTLQEYFLETNAALAVGILIKGALRQVLKWLQKAMGCITRVIPQLEFVFNILNQILYTIVNYVDMAVLSYIFYDKADNNSLRKACDGIVLWAQSWKSQFKGATKAVVMAFVFKWATVLVFTLIFGVIFNLFMEAPLGWIIGLIVGIAISVLAQIIFIDPMTTIFMIKSFYEGIYGQELKFDMYAKLLKVSSKFKKLWEKADCPPVPDMAGSEV
jgi:hypothetical protein